LNSRWALKGGESSVVIVGLGVAAIVAATAGVADDEMVGGEGGGVGVAAQAETIRLKRVRR